MRHIEHMAQDNGFKKKFVEKRFHDLAEKLLSKASVLSEQLNKDCKMASPVYAMITNEAGKLYKSLSR
jgi:hypothetical protein